MVLTEKTASLILGSILMLGAAWLFFRGQDEAGLAALLREKGRHVSGTVVNASERKSTSARRGGQTTISNYFLSVLYTVGGKLHTKEFETNREGFLRHPAGSSVPIHYDPADPMVSDLGPGLSVRGAAGPKIWAIVCVVLAAGLFVYGLRSKPKPA